MTAAPYAEILARNIRAARSRLGINQEALASRLRSLGFSAWLRQTVANVEKSRRRVTAEEILGLALALETTISDLMRATDQDGDVELPNGEVIGGVSVERLAGAAVNDRAVNWHGANDNPSYVRLTRVPGRPLFDPDLLSRPLFSEGPPGRTAAREDVAAVYLSPTGHRHRVNREGDDEGDDPGEL